MDEEFDLLPLFNTVAYPLAVTPLAISNPSAIRLLDTADGSPRRLVVIALRNATRRPAEPTLADCYTVGTLALVHRLLRLPDGTLRVAVEGLARVAVQSPLAGPGLRARAALLPDHEVVSRHEAERLRRALIEHAAAVPQITPELAAEMAAEDDPARLSFLAAGPLLQRASLAERQRLLEQCDPAARLIFLYTLLTQIAAHAPHPSLEIDIKKPALLALGTALRLSWSPQGATLSWVTVAMPPGYARVRVSGSLHADTQTTVQIALAAVCAQYADLAIDQEYLRRHDVYVAFSESDLRSDRYGGGGAAALALAGLLTGRRVRPGAMLLADLDLHGRLLPLPDLVERLAAATAEGVDLVVIAADQPLPSQSSPSVHMATSLLEALPLLLAAQ